MSIRKNKAASAAFTLLELIVVVVILSIIGILAYNGYSYLYHRYDEQGFDPDVYMYSEYHNTKANMQQAEEFRRANDLRERELRVQEQAIELERLKQQNAK